MKPLFKRYHPRSSSLYQIIEVYIKLNQFGLNYLCKAYVFKEVDRVEFIPPPIVTPESLLITLSLETD